jgi:hypothetical protein
VVVVIGALCLAAAYVLRPGARRPGLDDTKPPSARVAESASSGVAPQPGSHDTKPLSARVAESASSGVAPQPGSHDTDVHPGASLGRARAASGRPPQLPGRAPVPTTIEDAIESNPMLAQDLACRDPSARFNMDYELRMIAGLRDCLGSRTHSTGKFEFVLFFDNDPITRKGTGTGLEPRASELSPEDDAVVLGCLKAYVVGSEFWSSDKYGKGSKRYQGSQISLPLENSLVYKQVREGTYTPGYKSCDYP